MLLGAGLVVAAFAPPAEGPATGTDVPIHVAANGQICNDVGLGRPRVLQTTEGWYPCEASRYVGRDGDLEFYPGIQLRSESTLSDRFVMDQQGTEYDDSPTIHGRFRLRPELVWDNGRLVGTADFASGRWTAGGTPAVDEILRTGRPPQAPAKCSQCGRRR